MGRPYNRYLTRINLVEDMSKLCDDDDVCGAYGKNDDWQPQVQRHQPPRLAQELPLLHVAQ